MNIVIPTYKRPNDQKTWNTLHPDLRQFVTFVVRPEEAEHFRQTYAPSKVMETAPHVNDFGSTLQFLFDQHEERFIYMDDDLTGFYRRARFWQDPATLDKPWKKDRLLTAEEQLTMFTDILETLNQPYVASIGCRAGYLPPEGRRFKDAQANIQFMAVDGALVKKIGARWDRIKWASDLDFNLQLNHAGYNTLQRCDYSYTEPGVFNGEGGSNALLSREQRIATVNEMFEKLVALWPGVFIPSKLTNKNPDYPKPPYRAQRKKYLQQRRKELGIVV